MMPTSMSSLDEKLFSKQVNVWVSKNPKNAMYSISQEITLLLVPATNINFGISLVLYETNYYWTKLKMLEELSLFV